MAKKHPKVTGTKRFKSKKSYYAWLKRGHATGVFAATPGVQEVYIAGEKHTPTHKEYTMAEVARAKKETEKREKMTKTEEEAYVKKKREESAKRKATRKKKATKKAARKKRLRPGSRRTTTARRSSPTVATWARATIWRR